MQTADAEAVMREAGWAETVTYKPAGRAERSIKAIVERGVPQPLDGGDGRAVRPRLSIEVLNRSTAISDDGFGGISSAEVDTGQDKLSVAERIGQTARDMRVRELSGQDTAMLTLELR